MTSFILSLCWLTQNVSWLCTFVRTDHRANCFKRLNKLWWRFTKIHLRDQNVSYVIKYHGVHSTCLKIHLQNVIYIKQTIIKSRRAQLRNKLKCFHCIIMSIINFVLEWICKSFANTKFALICRNYDFWGTTSRTKSKARQRDLEWLKLPFYIFFVGVRFR